MTIHRVIYTQGYIHRGIYTHIHRRIYTHIAYIYTYIYTYIFIYTYKNTYTYTYTHIYPCTGVYMRESGGFGGWGWDLGARDVVAEHDHVKAPVIHLYL